MPTPRKVPDDLWAEIETLIPPAPPARDVEQVLNGRFRGMATNLVKEIADKAAVLSPERQREALALIEAMNANTQPETKRKPFKSVRGILKREMRHLDEDLADVRREMWQNFPRPGRVTSRRKSGQPFINGCSPNLRSGKG